jgi:hypothetical protein
VGLIAPKLLAQRPNIQGGHGGLLPGGQ